MLRKSVMDEDVYDEILNDVLFSCAECVYIYKQLNLNASKALHAYFA